MIIISDNVHFIDEMSDPYFVLSETEMCLDGNEGNKKIVERLPFLNNRTNRVDIEIKFRIMNVFN